MSLVSVIVPVYNVEPYLPRCIDSILCQTFTDFELILVDDGSPDNCGAICEKYAQRDNRIQVLHQENRGQAAARNRGLDIARGKYIAFVDSDDWVHPQYLQILLDNLLSCNAQISICGHAKVSQIADFTALQSQSPNCWNGQDYVHRCMTGEIPDKTWLLWDKLFHRDCFSSIRMPEGRIYEDNAVVYRILYEAGVIAECNDVLYYYFQNETGTMNQPFCWKHLDWLLVLQEMIGYYEEHNDDMMVDKCNRMYLAALENIYRKVHVYLCEPTLEAELKKKFRKQYDHEKRRYPITIFTHSGLYEILFPRYAWCYWTIRGIWNRLLRR